MSSTSGQDGNQLQEEIESLRTRVQELEAQLRACDVSGKKAAESVALLNAIDSLEDGLVIFNDAARLVYCNRRYREFYAPPSERWTRGTPFQTVARDTATECVGLTLDKDIDAWITRRAQAFNSPGTPSEQRLKDGRWLRATESRLANGWSVGVRTDITTLKRTNERLLAEIAERKSVARAMRVQGEQLRGFIEGAAPGLSLKDRDGRYLVTSRGFNHVFNLKPGDATGKLPIEVLPADIAQTVLLEDQEVLNTGRSVEQNMYIGEGSERRHLFTTRFPIFDSSNELVGLGLIFLDLTETPEIQRELRASQQLLSAVINTMPHFVFVKNRDSRYILVNKAYAEFYEQTIEEMQGFTTAESPHPSEEEKRMFIDEDRQVFELGKTVRRKDFLTVSQHGKQAYHDVIKLPLRDEEGRVTALLTVAEDITERRQAQLELERYQQELEGIITQRTLALEAAQEDLIRRERLATIGQITGTVAHELRNPLGTIQTSALFLNKLLRDSDPRVARILGRVERNIL